MHDRVAKTTERADVNSAGEVANRGCSHPSVSADGRFVAFSSWATNLAPGDPNTLTGIFVRDRKTGKTERVTSCKFDPNNCCEYPSISADGRFVVYTAGHRHPLPGDTNGYSDIAVYDRDTGNTTRVNIGVSGAESNHWCYGPAISGDGRFVAFASRADNLVPGDTNGRSDIFVARNPLAP